LLSNRRSARVAAARSWGGLLSACFSPDGGTLFDDVQDPGTTFAITGPWRR
jgi:hypothetical protein